MTLPPAPNDSDPKATPPPDRKDWPSMMGGIGCIATLMGAALAFRTHGLDGSADSCRGTPILTPLAELLSTYTDLIKACGHDDITDTQLKEAEELGCRTLEELCKELRCILDRANDGKSTPEA